MSVEDKERMQENLKDNEEGLRAQLGKFRISFLSVKDKKAQNNKSRTLTKLKTLVKPMQK